MAYFDRFSVLVSLSDGSFLRFQDITLAAARHEQDGFILETAWDGLLHLRLMRQDGARFTLAKVCYEFDLPLKNFQRFLVPDCGRYYNRYFTPLLSWGRTISVTGGNHGNPFVAFMNHHHEAVLALGLLGKFVELAFTITSPGRSRRNTLVVQNGRFRFSLEQPAGGFQLGQYDRYEEVLFVAEGQPSWFHALRGYAGAYDRLYGRKFEILEEASHPTWCSWVPWNSDDLDEEKILANAALAKELGIGTIIIDDGWYGPGCDSDSLASNMGDYRPDPGKFPDLAGTAKKIKELGLQGLLWVAPLAVSPEAMCYNGRKDLLMMEDGKLWRSPSGFHDLCPCCPAARRAILQQLPDLLAYGFDGLKVDLYNNISNKPCTASHPHDCATTTEGVMVLMREYWQRLKELKPDAVMESKNNYANVYSSQFGSMTRGGDSPFDIDNNFWNCVYPRAYTPIVHNDYLCWTPAEDERDLAILLIKQITAGVPTISVDLRELSKAHREILRAWLHLFNQYRRSFVHGRLEPENGVMDVWSVDDGETAIISLLHDAKEFHFPAGRKRVLVLNATNNEVVYIRTKGGMVKQENRDHRLRPVAQYECILTDRGYRPIPPAGLAVFTVE